MIQKSILAVALLVAQVHGMYKCQTNTDCDPMWFAKQCCLETDGISQCNTHCAYGNADMKDTMDALVLGFQTGADESKTTEYDCMTEYLNQPLIVNGFINAYKYGSAGGYYMPSQQLNQVGHNIGIAAKHCKNFWQQLFGDIEELANIFINIAKMICQYKSEIMAGDEVVPEAAPIIDGIVGASCAIGEIDDLYECGKDVVYDIQRKRECAQQIIDIEQYVAEFAGGNDLQTLGNYAGKIFHANQECQPIKGTATACWNAAKGAIDELSSGDDEEPEESEEIMAPQSQVVVSSHTMQQFAQPRQLEEAQVINQPDCPFCLTEEQFISFFEGYYQGQAKLNANISEAIPDIKKCLNNNEALKSAFTGGLQANLTELMLSYKLGNLNATKDSIVGINQFIQDVVNKKENDCSKLQHADDVNLESAIKVNGTQLQFLNVHGRLVDMTATPRLAAKLYQNYTMLQANGQLTTQNQELSKIGAQLGMSNMLLARTGTAHLEQNESSKLMLILIIVFALMALGILMALCVYKFLKRSKVNRGGAQPSMEEEATPNLVGTINDDSINDEIK